MDNVPVNANGPAAEGRHTGHPVNNSRHDTPRGGKKKSMNLKYVAMAAVVTLTLLVVVFGGWLLYRSSMGAHIDANKYQAVFFTNGQVYFGKLQKLSGGYFKLNDIFYLQAKADAATAENPQETSAQKTSDVELIKLGSEVHGPDDEMIISKDQVLFFENLKKDGKVSQSITNFKAPQ